MANDWGVEEAHKRWERHAEEIASTYRLQGDRSREMLLNPVILEYLSVVRQKKVLDIGCGEGYLSRMLASEGASVVAVDYSRKMIEIAQERTPPDTQIEYLLGDCQDMGFFGESFDIVVANMVMQDLPEYEAVLREVFRVLVPGGKFVFSILHPCFMAPEGEWVRDEKGERLYWKMDRYFDETVFPQRYPIGTEDGVLQFHRTLSSYYNATRRAGFDVEAIAEPKPSDEMLVKYREWRDDLRICHFLVFKAWRQPG